MRFFIRGCYVVYSLSVHVHNLQCVLQHVPNDCDTLKNIPVLRSRGFYFIDGVRATKINSIRTAFFDAQNIQPKLFMTGFPLKSFKLII